MVSQATDPFSFNRNSPWTKTIAFSESSSRYIIRIFCKVNSLSVRNTDIRLSINGYSNWWGANTTLQNQPFGLVYMASYVRKGTSSGSGGDHIYTAINSYQGNSTFSLEKSIEFKLTDTGSSGTITGSITTYVDAFNICIG